MHLAQEGGHPLAVPRCQLLRRRLQVAAQPHGRGTHAAEGMEHDGMDLLVGCIPHTRVAPQQVKGVRQIALVDVPLDGALRLVGEGPPIEALYPISLCKGFQMPQL